MLVSKFLNQSETLVLCQGNTDISNDIKMEGKGAIAGDLSTSSPSPSEMARMDSVKLVLHIYTLQNVSPSRCVHIHSKTSS